MSWVDNFLHDPIKPLVDSNNPYIQYFSLRDLYSEQTASIETIWELPHPQNIIKEQTDQGSWKSRNPNRKRFPLVNYELLETWRNLRYLVQMYDFDKSYPAIENACEFVFSCQSEEGDIRGILANQHAMYYTGAILYLLIKAGYERDQRVVKGLDWLLTKRQNDGGWVASPHMTLKLTGKGVNELTTTSKVPLADHNRDKPFSHTYTGMVLRAFAEHPSYRYSKEAKQAANLLKAQFFKADNYSSYKHPQNWVRFQFPYWWNHLVAALDTLTIMKYNARDKDVQKALLWLVEHQQEDGLWKSSYSSIHKLPRADREAELKLWISLTICRIFKRAYKSTSPSNYG